MARWQGGGRNELRVPCRHQVATGVRVGLQTLDEFLDLVELATVSLLPAPPLGPVHLADLTVAFGELFVIDDALLEFLQTDLPLVGIRVGYGLTGLLEVSLVGPLRPDVHVVLEQVPDVRVSTKEPHHLNEDGVVVDVLRRDQREALRKVEPHFPTEDTQRTDTSTVVLECSVLENVPKEVLVRCGDFYPRFLNCHFTPVSQGHVRMTHPPPTTIQKSCG